MLKLTEREALLCLNTINGLGAKKLEDLLVMYANYANIWASCYPHEPITPSKILEDLSNSNTQYITIIDKEYPALLKQISSPPIVLYYQGNISLLNTTGLGIVGTRNPSVYSEQVLNLIIPDLVSTGFTIVSGFQRGVDTLSHKKTVEQNGKTIAVTGTGLDIDYPTGNRKLREQILSSNGLIISEYPLKTPPYKANFPRRNRIISGLSLGVIIVEAALQSGSLITAKFALEQNREVFAIPGSIFSSNSLGTHYLIQQGAKLIQNTQEIYNELGIQAASSIFGTIATQNYSLTDTQQKILNYLDVYGKHIDLIIQELNLQSAQVMSDLTLLEIEGIVLNLGNGLYSKSRA